MGFYYRVLRLYLSIGVQFQNSAFITLLGLMVPIYRPEKIGVPLKIFRFVASTAIDRDLFDNF